MTSGTVICMTVIVKVDCSMPAKRSNTRLVQASPTPEFAPAGADPLVKGLPSWDAARTFLSP
jgi:hypothetical protein